MINDELIGSFIGKYLIEKCIGKGAMGEVYLGIHPKFGEKIAIKILAKNLSINLDFSNRFILEALAHISHKDWIN
jgi:serine/threonine-protein kinase